MTALSLTLTVAPLSAQAFEGSIAMRVTLDNGATRELEYQVKDNKVRFEAPGRGGQSAGIVIDPANQRMLILMPTEKMYMEQPIPPAARTQAAKAATSRATLTSTGKKETIAGHECEHFLVTDQDGATVDACLARGLGTFMSPPVGNPMTGGAPPSADDWASKIGTDAFPLKVTKGSTTILEVTKIEKAALDPSLFSPPAGWKKFELPKIPGIRPPSR